MSTATTAPEAPGVVRSALAYRPHPRHVPVLATLALLVAMWSAGALRYENFSHPQVLLDVFINNGFLLVVGVGMTFVILTGGIDLSVGSVVALTTVLSASLLEKQHWNPLLVIATVLLVGTVLGAAMGTMIHVFDVQPFIATLAGMFLARGLCYVISLESIPIDDKLFTALATKRIPLGGDLSVTWSVVIALATVAVAAYVLHQTRFGRTVYAIGGNQQSALLMGLAVGRTKIAVYAISGLCSALGGVLMAFYTLSGYSLNAVGMELDAIAAVVIGGTLLTGGVGYVFGTVLGVLVLGLIQTLIAFDGTLSSWWTRMFVGAILFVFVLLQRAVTTRGDTR
ncbi:galactofuranose ABC transporter, permease protein YjfF [Spongisporangium articulatum]|uniref:Galactofuranose ABC transporter, permease protein YjfF n=1 Tax=Spongisporangium articulatum TaxID=3362603 RepID=A0ABW8AMD5_9ACTN